MRFSLTKKIFFNFLILSIVPIIVLDSYFYYKSKQALIDRTFDQLTTVRIEKTNRLKDFFNQRFYFLKTLAHLSNTDSIFYYLNKSDTSYNKTFILFKNTIRQNVNFKNPSSQIILMPRNNKIWYFDRTKNYKLKQFSGDFVEIQSLRLAKRKSIHTDKPIIYDVRNKISAKRPSILMAKTIFKGHQEIGTIILEISLQAINKIMYENNTHNGLGKTGETYLVGNDYYMRSSSRFKNNSIFNIKVNTVGVNEALNKIVGRKQILDYRNIQVLSSYSPVDIPQLDWVVLAEIDTKEAMIPISLIRNDIIFMSLILSILLLGLVEIFSSKITAPIRKLKHETDKLSKGEIGSIVSAGSNDEIGDLIIAFNKMVIQLKEQSEKIENERILRTKSMIDGQEIERQRLSRELHDSLGQSILALKLKFEQIAEVSETNKTKIIVETQKVFSTILNEIRNISNDLMPAVLSEFGLILALKKISREFGKNTGIETEFESNIESEAFDKKIEVYIYRIVQEAFSNIQKHSKATKVELTLLKKETHFEIIIQDNGIGFLQNEKIYLQGNGLSNMKERINLLSGQINISSKPNHGTLIFCKIPIK